MGTDPHLAEIGRLLAVYEQNHSRPGSFDCCSAHAVADRVPGLVAELVEATTKLKIVERAVDDLRTMLVERDAEIAGLLADEVDLSDDQAGVPA